TGDNALLPSKLVNPIPSESPINRDRIDRIGNREQILESNCKLGGRNHRINAPSGIPVRVTNTTVKSESSLQRHCLETRQQNRGFYCQECGSKFPSTNARFCPNCGVRRLAI
uniref:Zinc finger C2HC domain-containing protein 1B n=1 Tax=Mesocestoides corti TaxID=53468 RepID=A0A5K3FK06_MESCO